jgi:acyl-CoA dehydrogenase
VSLVVLIQRSPLAASTDQPADFRTYKRILPQMSETERVALEAGTVWWDGELFRGNPDWNKLLAYPVPKLSQKSSPSWTMRSSRPVRWSMTGRSPAN